jgi:hypothetical protein
MADNRPGGEHSPEQKKKPKRQVHIFGAGIAGLTAAHELAIRGFDVHVYESAKVLDSRGYKALAIGGLARTQYFQASLSRKPMESMESRESEWEIHFEHNKTNGPPPFADVITDGSGGIEQARPYPSLWLKFDSEPDDKDSNKDPKLTVRSQSELAAMLETFAKDPKQFGDFRIHIQPFYDQALYEIESAQPPLGNKDKDSSDENKKAWKRAEIVKEELLGHLKKTMKKTMDDALDLIHINAPLPANTEFGQAPSGRDWVRVVVERRILPGEHGFRYFPSYYRHVFDTMRRIPVYDHNSRPTPRTTYDNLVALPNIGIASEKRPPFVMNWESYRFPDSFARAAHELISLRDLGITLQDLFQFSLRILRYMLTCPERRATELENISWWQYLEGYNPKTGGKLYRYSDAFTHLVKSSGRVLVALDGEWSDARTTGNSYVQLLTDVLVPTEGTHATLNGPTSEAWFNHWQTHLRRLGVRFHQGTLKGFKRVESVPGTGLRFEPDLEMPPPEETPTMEPNAYYLVAVDVLTAEEIAKTLPCIGVPDQLRGYTTLVPTTPGAQGSRKRDPRKNPGMYGWDRLQTLSGIQYFFDTEFNLIDGYLYLVDAPWGISAICSPIAWQHRPIQGLNRYQSLLSVDIGEWGGSPPIKAAWDSTPMELGKETWKQILNSLGAWKDRRPFLHFDPPEPACVHIDQGLVFNDPDPSKARIIRNDTPFLLPTVGDWQYRPGPEPWDPTPGARPPHRTENPPPGLWQAPHGGYWVHWDQIVFAGTYNRTFTRLTTMESANESARHAVNAILDHYSMREGKPPLGHRPTPLHEELFPTTPHGDYCRIWDPEVNELPDLMFLRQQDALNFEHRLPHLWDMLGVEVFPSMLSQLGGNGAQASAATAAPTDFFTQVESLLRELGKHAGPGGGEGLLELLRRIRTHLEENLRRGAAGYQPPTR